MMKHFLYCAFLFGVACVSLVLPVLLRLSGWHSGCRYLRVLPALGQCSTLKPCPAIMPVSFAANMADRC